LRAVLFLTALSTLLVEVLLTRVLSVVMWYHFTFAVISIALLGIAAGAMHCYRRFPAAGEEIVATAFWQALSVGLTLFAITVLLPIALMLTIVATPTVSWTGGLLLLAYFLACMAPFAVSGYLTTAVLRFGSRRVAALYAIDLLAAALGCLLAIPLLNYLGGIASLLTVSCLAAAGSALLARKLGDRRRTLSGGAVALAVGSLLVLQLTTAKVDLHTVKVNEREAIQPILEVKWNSNSRLAMVDWYDSKIHQRITFMSWGLSDRYQGWLPRQHLITIDGASETPLAQIKEDLSEHKYLEWDVTALPYHLRRGAKTLVIGAGGGRDLMTAVYFGSRDVTGVELNPDIAAWVTGRYADWNGRFFLRPEVHLIVDDGRNFVRASPDKYDVLQISMIDTFAASSAGAYALAENNLYTVEAFDEYLDHLTDDGILSVNRFFLEPPQQTLRVATLARTALQRRGITDPAKHIVVLRREVSLANNNGLVMVKKTPFTTAELDQVRALCTQMNFEPIAVPDMELTNAFTAYLREPDPAKYYADYPFDVRPPTDDWPFFFNTFKMSLFSLQLRQQIEQLRVYNFDAVFILFVLLVLALVSLALFLFVPLMRQRREPGRARLPASQLIYFVWVGLGFILVEVVLIQRFHLYLGHPVYSLAVILVSLLTFSGLGSAWASRWGDTPSAARRLVACLAVAVLIVALEVAWPAFLAGTLGLPLTTRIALSVLVLMPIGLAMGMPYPLGLQAVSASQPAGLPWVWAVNGAASVLGSILAFALAMVVGFHIVLLLGSACYILAALWASRLQAPATAGPLEPAKESETSLLPGT
jgi:hypothetical protein